MTFRSKIDGWIALLSMGAALACLGGLIHVAITKSILLALIMSPLLLVGVVIPIWLLSSTYYVLKDTELLVKSGPLQWRVPIGDIRAITPTRSPLSSPALSLDRLRIDYQRWKSIMISPADKEGFLQELENRRSRLAESVGDAKCCDIALESVSGTRRAHTATFAAGIQEEKYEKRWVGPSGE